jgi:glutaredoxin
MRATVVLLALTLLAAALLAYAAPSSWEPRAKLSFSSVVQQAALSPDGAYVVVISSEGFNVLLSVYDSWLKPLWSVQLASSFSYFTFAGSDLLVVAERLFGQVPSTKISVYRLASGELVHSEVVRGGVNEQILSAHRVGSYIYLLTSKELVVIDTRKEGGARVLISFANRGLQALGTDEGLVVLYIDTLCHICLERNQKTVALVEAPSSISTLTLDEVLALVSVGGKPALYMANGSLIPLSLRGKVELEGARPAPLLSGYPRASEPGYKLLYSLGIRDLEVEFSLLDPSTGKVVTRKLPLPYEKGDEVGLRVYDDGSFVAWCKNTTLVGTPEGSMSSVTLEFPVQAADLRNSTLLVVGTRSLATYAKVARAENTSVRTEEVYSLYVIARDESGSMPASFTVFVNGSFAGTFSGTAQLLLPRGFYKLSIVAPGYSEATLEVGLRSNTTVHAVLRKLRYSLLVQAEETGGPPPEILLLRNSSVVARGAGVLEVAVTPGVYTVVVRGLRGNLTRSVSVQGDTSVYFYLLVEQAAPSQQFLNESSAAREAVNVTAVVMYGSESCPSCRKVKEILTSLGVQLEYRDLSNRTFLEEYYYLYDYIGAGSAKAIPLVLVFQGEHLTAAAACEKLTRQEWQQLLQRHDPNATLVVRDDCSWTVRRLNGSEVYRVVFGGKGLREEKPAESMLPLILALAAADSINPCTFLVFSALLMTTLAAAGRRRTVGVSAAFISAVFVCYLLLGLGLIRVIAHFWWLKGVVALAVVAAGLYELSRGARSTREEIASLARRIPQPKLLKKLVSTARSAIARAPARLEPRGLDRVISRLKRFSGSAEAATSTLLQRARGGSVAMAALAGAAVSFTLLPCSSGPYLVAALALSKLPLERALLYLVLYNLVFVLPLIVIAVSVVLGEKYLASVEIFRMKTETLRKYIDVAVGALLLALGLYFLSI